MFCNNLSRGQAGDKLVKHVGTKLLDDLVEHINSANINWGGAVACEVVWVPTAETPTASRVPGTGTVDVHRDRRWKWRCSSPVGWSSSVPYFLSILFWTSYQFLPGFLTVAMSMELSCLAK